jgi:hypothetical protein
MLSVCSKLSVTVEEGKSDTRRETKRKRKLGIRKGTSWEGIKRVWEEVVEQRKYPQQPQTHSN